mmetsp:Transcript_16171/g.42018  ORF Transcript_16171/g.42018 Transcript_16171/m.42018 type:complete len:224 (+) Transcript_16171:79-750(+)
MQILAAVAGCSSAKKPMPRPPYSHANLLSKEVRQMQNACMAQMGHAKSIVKVSLPTLPNCRITWSSSSSDTSWKFFTLACVTRPLKLRQYAPSDSFHLGGLFFITTNPSLLPLLKQDRMLPSWMSLPLDINLFSCWSSSSSSSSSPFAVNTWRRPLASTTGMHAVILRGPRTPMTLYWYITEPISQRVDIWLTPTVLSLFPGLAPLSKSVNSVPTKLERSLPK